jgi:RimJ/RimL family protein N-acetyltransferase
MPPTPQLETDRLWLKPIGSGDAPTVQRRFPRWDIVRFLAARVPWPYPPDGADSYIGSLLAEMEAGSKNAWGLWLKGGPNELIGMIELWPPKAASPTRESRGFWLDPEYQRRGLMTEAADRVVDYAFQELAWPFLLLGNAKSHSASARIKERQGAVLIGELPFVFVSGEDLMQVWRLDADDWKKRQKPNHR